MSNEKKNVCNRSILHVFVVLIKVGKSFRKPKNKSMDPINICSNMGLKKSQLLFCKIIKNHVEWNMNENNFPITNIM